jgi:hypothetical protein
MPKTMESSSPKLRKPRTTKTPPSHEDIALRAYQIFLERGGAPGNPVDDWTRAERELLTNKTKPRRKPTLKLIAAA